MIKKALKSSRKLKKIIIIIVAILFIPIIAMTIIISLVDPNRYKNQIVTLASNKLNRQVIVDGKISWSIFPLGITLKDFKITNDPKFKSGSEYMITSNTTTISLKLLPLLTKKIQINSLDVHGATVYLSKDDFGYTNWQSIININQKNSTDDNRHHLGKNYKPHYITNKPSSNSVNKQPSAIPELSIKKIHITNSSIFWQQPNEKVMINDLNLQGNDIYLDSSSPFDLTGSFNMQLNQQITAHIDFKSEVTINNNLQNISINIPITSIELGGKAYPKHPRFKITTTVDLNLEQSSFKITDFNANLNHILLSGNLRGDFNNKTPNLEGKIKIAKSIFDDFLHDINLETPKETHQSLSGEFNITTNRNFITVDPLRLNFNNDAITGFIKIDASKTPYYINASLNADNFNLDYLSIKKNQRVETSNITKSKSSANNNFDNNSESNQISQIFSEPLKIILAKLNVKYSSKIKTLHMWKRTVTNFNLNTIINNGSINNSSSFKIYQGDVKLESKTDIRQNITAWQGNIAIDKMKIELFLKDQFHSSKPTKISGDTNFNLKYNTVGNNFSQLFESITGKMKLKLNDGYINGIDLNNIMTIVNSELDLGPEKILSITQSIMSLWQKNSNSKSVNYIGPNQRTKITSLSATGLINNGILTNNDLSIDMPLIIMAGHGNINLKSETIDYNIRLNSKTAKNSNLEVPINITGNLYAPNYSIDSQKLFKSNIFKSLIKRNLPKIEKQIQKIPGLGSLPVNEIKDALGL